ncbi:MAG: sialidase family protein [Phycisphaeraceae bacterium]
MTDTFSKPTQGFRIRPGHPPNEGIVFVNHQAHQRSGHGGNCLTECHNGDILAFYSNVSGDLHKGHGIDGWSEYRRSSDGGETWGEPMVLPYSKQAWEGDDVYAALVFGVTTADNGDVIAFACQFAEGLWVKAGPPVVLVSHDQGQTWDPPRPLTPDATVDDASLTFDATLVHEGVVYVVFMSGAANYCPGPYAMYASTDHGRTFELRSRLPFHQQNYYVTAGVLDDGSIIVYSYPYRTQEPINEHDIDYVISSDGGRTWSDVSTTHFAKKIRNPQMSAKIGDYYFLHGRSGSLGEEKGHLVLYASRDGIHWNKGLILRKKTFGGGDAYSANEVVSKYDPSVPKRLLIQSSIAYEDGNSRVNEHHWWVEDIAGADHAAGDHPQGQP